MKKAATFEVLTEGAKRPDYSWIIPAVLGALMAVLLGFGLGMPSKEEEREAKALQANYKAVEQQLEQAYMRPKSAWDCVQGEVKLHVEERDYTNPRNIYFGSGGGSSRYTVTVNGNVQAEEPAHKVIKTVSEETTMKCGRQVKEYVEEAK